MPIRSVSLAHVTSGNVVMAIRLALHSSWEHRLSWQWLDHNCACMCVRHCWNMAWGTVHAGAHWGNDPFSTGKLTSVSVTSSYMVSFGLLISVFIYLLFYENIDLSDADVTPCYAYFCTLLFALLKWHKATVHNRTRVSFFSPQCGWQVCLSSQRKKKKKDAV